MSTTHLSPRPESAMSPRPAPRSPMKLERGYYHFTPRPVTAHEIVEQLLADEELMKRLRTLLRKSR